ncbi:MFS transporter [Teredinibacter haidensis]|uniref:MFS transporter n=1 Tax=Teredinibacter haidensis TaxID=2731755 RepID=UPI001FE9F5B3|nr:MFS transporter [Teredinibacter haidensis]
MVLPVLMLYGGEYLGASPLLLGFALGVYGLTQALFQIPLGLLSDIWGRKPVIFLGLVVFAVGSLVAAQSTSIEGLIVGRALQGSGAIASAIMAMVADLTSEENRTRAMAAIGASIGLSFSVAMILGPGVAAFAGLSGVFSLSSVLAVAGMLVLIFVVPTPPRAPATHRDTGAIPALIFASVKNTELLRLNWGIFSLHFVLMTAFIVVPQVLEQRFTIGRESHWMVYLLLLGVAFVLMLPLVVFAERKRRVKLVFVGAVAILGLSLAVPGFFVVSKEGWFLLLLVFFTAFNLLEASLPSLVSKLAPAGAKGTAMGVYSTSQFLGAFLGGVSGGWVLQYGGVEQVYWLGTAVVALWFLIAVTMRSPRYLSSLSVSVQRGFHATMDILAVPGVEEALLVSEDSLLYLKVDKQQFDEDELYRVLRREC